MVAFPFWALIMLLVIAGIGVVAMLHSVATTVRNDLHVHILMTEAAGLRAEYMRRLQRLADDAGVELDELTDDADVDIID